MPRYVAFLRGVSPTNLRMLDLQQCLEAVGFTDVKTVLSSGNVVFDSRSRSAAALEKQIEAILESRLGRTFFTVVRSVKELRSLLARDPYAQFDLAKDAKRVITFARKLAKVRELPIERDGAQILVVEKSEAFSAYVPGGKGPVFMELIGASFGANVTTRTWETVKKCARA